MTNVLINNSTFIIILILKYYTHVPLSMETTSVKRPLAFTRIQTKGHHVHFISKELICYKIKF